MTRDFKMEQRIIDRFFEPEIVVQLHSPFERALAATRRGVREPALLSDDEIRLVCKTLLDHYAQMGIG